MKRITCIIAALCVLLMTTAAYAAPEWTENPPATQTAEAQNETDKTQTAEAPVYGYLGRAGSGAVDVDGDGETDLTVPPEDIIDVTVPLNVAVLATYNGADKKFFSGVGTVWNNSRYSSVAVSMTSFTRQAGNVSEVTLGRWDGRLSQHQVAMQIQPTVHSVTRFAAQDVTTIRTSPVAMGTLGPDMGTEYTFDGQFETSLVRVHKGEEVVFDTVFMFTKA